MAQGLQRTEIKEIAIRENIYQVDKEYRIKEILNGTYSRLELLPKEMIRLLVETDVSTAKMIVLTSIMQSNRFFFEFVNEVLREKIVTGEMEITDRDINVFFNKKCSESHVVAVWTEVSMNKLKSTIPRYLFEAGLLSHPSRNRMIVQAKMDYKAKKIFEDNNMMAYYYAITAEV